MATYSFTTGTDTFSLTGTNTVIATAATVGTGDTLYVGSVGTTVQIQGGGALDFGTVSTHAPYVITKFTLDDNATSLTFADGTYDYITPGAGADTITAPGAQVFYSNQAGLAGDHLNGFITAIQGSGTIDLTGLASFDGANLLEFAAGANIALDQATYDKVNYLVGIHGLATLTLVGDDFELDRSIMANLDLVSTSLSGIDLKMDGNTFASIHSFTGVGTHDVIELSYDSFVGKSIQGLEEVKFNNLSIAQANATAIHTFTGTGPNSVLTANGSLDLSANDIVGVSAIHAKGTIVGSEGADTIIADGSGNDTIHGGGGDDRISGQAGSDQINGDAGQDTLLGGAGADTLTGGVGNDQFLGTAADLSGDRITDLTADDRIIVSDYSAATTTVSYVGGVLTIDGDGAGSGAPITIALDGSYDGTFSVYDSGSGAGIQFTPTPLPPAAPTTGADTLSGSTGSDTIDGLAGNDSIAGLGGNDSLSGSAGNDTIDGGDGNDTVMGLNDNDSVFGGNGDDLVRGGNGTDYVDGGAGNDAIWGDPGNDTLVGGAGADRFFFVSAYGNDRILDFNYDDGDRIRLDKALSVSATADNAAGDAVVTTSDGSTITLVGHHASEIQAGWFGL